MRVILARRLQSASRASGPPSVHAYQIPEDVGSASVLRAACGDLLRPGEGEIVEEFTGVPCTPCVMLLARVNHEPRQASPEPPAMEVVDSGRFAVALRGECVTHLVGEGAVRGKLDGRDVVQTLCCFMAWGPLHTSPEGWPMCSECAGIEGAA